MILANRIKAIRQAEQLSRQEFALLVGIPLIALTSYELGRRTPHETHLLQITNHPKLKKYTYWLMTGETLPKAGQVCPEFVTLPLWSVGGV